MMEKCVTELRRVWNDLSGGKKLNIVRQLADFSTTIKGTIPLRWIVLLSQRFSRRRGQRSQARQLAPADP
jgi:hypothetical protein